MENWNEVCGMNLWNMSISGGILIAVIAILRSLFRYRLPGRVFQVLWLAAFLRLMIPFSIPCQFSIYSLAENVMEFSGWEKMKDGVFENEAYESIIPGSGLSEMEASGNDLSMPAGERAFSFGWMLIYLAGAGLCVCYYIISYVRWHREFQTALPIEEKEVQAWAEALPLRRRVHIRQWEMTETPLTYGIIHPVILLPKALVKEVNEQLRFVMVHEYMHIRHFDAAKKMFLLLSCCVHWFNPLVWVMLILANRDMEMDCDEHVLGYLGGDMRAAYAHALIDMEEQKNIRVSWGNSFSKNAMKERVVAIMKGKKKSILIGVLSGVLTTGLILAFATSAAAGGRAVGESSNAVAGVDYPSDIPDEETYENENYENEAVAPGNLQIEYEAYDETTTVMMEDEKDEYYEHNVDESSNAVAVAGVVSSLAYARDSVPEVPEEYVSYGITSNSKTGAWEYQEKRVAALYDKGICTMIKGSSGKGAVYLEVRRDKKGEINEIKKRSKKKMQNLLKSRGLMIE